MVVRIAQWALRICVGSALIPGILFWTDHADSLVLVHVGLRILVVLSLWTLGVAQALTKGEVGAWRSGPWGSASSSPHPEGREDELLTGSWHWVIQGMRLLLPSLERWARDERPGPALLEPQSAGHVFAIDVLQIRSISASTARLPGGDEPRA